jgi:UDP-GlcNAc:undecaprenyl-phosphate/decaprenyl-phosphate GlcNAc-1-phosphate transferase
MFLLLVLSVSYLASVVTIWLLLKTPAVKLFGDKPDHRKVHQQVVPRLGGLGIILAFFLVFALRWHVPLEAWPRSGNQFSLALLFIAVFLAATGALDDIRNINFKVKFLFQFILAAGITLLLGHHFGTFSLFGHAAELDNFGSAITILWIMAVMNALNIIDGIDGLAGGVALCGFGATALIAYSNGAVYILAISLVFAGLTLGFLRFNLSRRDKVFLGDSGSQFLGAVLALLAVEVQRMPTTDFSVLVPLLVVGYPLFDTLVAMIRRFFKRNRRRLSRRITDMFLADNEHLHHRLVYLGLSHLQASFLLILVAGSFATSAVIIARVDVPIRIGVCAYLALSLFLILNRLGYVGIKPWLTFPRLKPLPPYIIGVIEPDELFFHSLKSFKQEKFEFLNLPEKLGKFLGQDLVAVMLYNALRDRFDEQFTAALRATEYHDRPAILIAESADIDRIKANRPEGFKSIHFLEKPVRIPDLIRKLETIARERERGSGRQNPREPKFSLAEIALRNNVSD